MDIHGFQTLTLLDYPQHIAATIFLGGCNFRCPYCHNGELVLHPDSSSLIDESEVFAHLKKRKGVLNGVAITGGEPTLRPDLPEFIQKIKDLGYEVKLDTNGSNPALLKRLVENHLIDYVAMDIKQCPAKYMDITQCSSLDFSKVEDSVSYLLGNPVPYEFRTTVVKELHQASDFAAIGKWIFGASAYFLQNYKDSQQVICPGFHSFSLDDLRHFREIMLPYVPNTCLRGVDE